MIYDITNGARRAYAFRTPAGQAIVEPGQTSRLDIEISATLKARQEARGVRFAPVKGQPSQADETPLQPAEKGAGDDAGKEPPEDMKALRAEYEAKLGKKPFPGWDADTLRAKMAEG